MHTNASLSTGYFGPLGDDLFCETDLPIDQFVQETQPAANVMQTHLHKRVVVAFEPLEGLPVHTFWFATITVQDARLPG